MAQAPVREPDVFGKQLAKKKKGRFWKGFGLVALVVVAAGFSFAVFTQQGRDTYEIGKKYLPAVLPSIGNPDRVFDLVGNDHINILLVGQDRNWKQGKVLDPKTGTFRPYQVIDDTTRPRADTMIVCSLDKATNAMKLISLPRDSRIRYRDFDGIRHKTKLNAVYAQPDGDKLLPKVLDDELGIRIDRIAKIKLDGFTKLIDRVGGLELNVEGAKFGNKRTRMKYEDKWGGWKVDLEPGMQMLDGEQAHGYVRFRMDNEGDPGRVRRQQQVMRALAKKMMNVGVLQMPGLIKEIQNLFLSDMTDDEVVAAANFAHSLSDPSKITPLTPYGVYAENGDIILNKPENLKLFKAIFGTSFNPDHFLVLSPETKGDDIGERNNDSPAGLKVLTEAGLIDKSLKTHDANFEAPGLQ